MRMHRVIPMALLILLLAAPSAFAARGFSHGVTPGEVTASSAILWGKAKKSGRYTLTVARNKRLTRGARSTRVRARKSRDRTVQRRIRRLRPNTRYWFRFSRGRLRSDRGTFRTAPRARQSRTIEFAWSGDQDFNPAPGQRNPYWNGGGVLRQMRAERNHFNVMLGDTMYSDSEIPGRLNPIAISVRQKWAKYKVNLRNRHLRALRRSAGFYSHWDDHEFVNDFSPAENSFDNGVNINGRTLYRRGAKAFRDYSPVRFSRRNGLYRKVRWGRNLELFFLDQRSFRSQNADEGGVCDNPQTGEPDFAPTAPQSTRTVFSAAVPSLAQPVSQACLDRIRSPQRTFLGERQKERFLRDVQASTARFKVIMNEMPIQQYYTLPYDRWEGYEAERQELLRALRDNVKNVIFLTTDVHATLVNDARIRTLEPGGPQNSGITDVTVGPVATANFALEIDTATGRQGNGALADNAFFTPPPPQGVGMRCSVLDQFSYGQVRVTANQLIVTPKDADGAAITDNGRPCNTVLNFTP
jgi:phosphodiesterase/alkaline phosphatase D-like protein